MRKIKQLSKLFLKYEPWNSEVRKSVSSSHHYSPTHDDMTDALSYEALFPSVKVKWLFDDYYIIGG